MSGLRKALQGTASVTGELLITLGLLVGLYIL
jgi:hypothetical protein